MERQQYKSAHSEISFANFENSVLSPAEQSQRDLRNSIYDELRQQHLDSLRQPQLARLADAPKNRSDEIARTLGGIPAGFVNRSGEFLEFMATPNAVSDALIGTGPMLDNAVNYYANHLMNGTTADIVKDAGTAIQAVKQGIDTYIAMPPETRGEMLGGVWVDVLLVESCSSVAGRAFKANALGEQLTERAVPSFRNIAGAGGDWKVINERVSADVVKQTHWDSCVAACGEMLSNGKLSQAELFAKLKSLTTPGKPGTETVALADLLGPEWEAGRLSPESFNGVMKRGPFAAELKDWTIPGRPKQSLAHTVVVDGIDERGLIRIKDPQHGTRYEMMREEFLRVWTGCAIFRK